LLEKLPAFLSDPDPLLTPGAPPHLIHADLTADHLLMKREGERWSVCGLIDFGDAMVGSLYYELVALQIDLLRGDRNLMRNFLVAYGLEEHEWKRLPRRALSAALLHCFDVIGPALSLRPELKRAPDLETLAELLWGLA
jgi:hygromycin-B 7''-O-kinase